MKEIRLVYDSVKGWKVMEVGGRDLTRWHAFMEHAMKAAADVLRSRISIKVEMP